MSAPNPAATPLRHDDQPINVNGDAAMQAE